MDSFARPGEFWFLLKTRPSFPSTADLTKSLFEAMKVAAENAFMDSYLPHPMHGTRTHERGGVHRRRRCHRGANHLQGQGEASHRSALREPRQITRYSRFDIERSSKSLHSIFLKSRHLVEDATWPTFTLGQSLGSMHIAWETVSELILDLFVGS